MRMLRRHLAGNAPDAVEPARVSRRFPTAWARQQFNDTLQARISLSGQPQLRELTSGEDDNFTIALLDAFSVMADVLTFYTERYGNGSYLRTAVQRQSVVDLAALVGYEPSPGRANTALAFTIDPATGAFGPALARAGSVRLCPRQVRPSRFRPARACRVFRIIRLSSRNLSKLRRSQAQPDVNAIPPQMTVQQSLCNPAHRYFLHLHCKRGDESEAGRYPADLPAFSTGNSPQKCSLLYTVSKVTVLPDGKTTGRPEFRRLQKETRLPTGYHPEPSLT